MEALAPAIFSKIADFFYSPALLAKIQGYINPALGQRLLDVPCGTGTLFHLCQPCEYHGVDIDEKRIQTMQNRYAGKATVHCASAAELPYPDQFFDRILAAGLFHHVPEDIAQKILLEFNRVLKKDGQFILFDAIWPQHWWNLAGYFGRKMDQGKFVRHAKWYEQAISAHFTPEKCEYPSRLGLEYILATFNKRTEEV